MPDLRRRPWPAFLLILLALTLAAAAFTAYRSSRLPRGGVTGAPAVRPDLAGAAGANLGPEVLSSFALESELGRLDSIGIRWIRMRMDWGEVEPERGRFEWDDWDARMTLFVGQRTLRPVLVLDGAPAWARRPVDAANPLAPPGERSDFGRFAAAVATRYGILIDYYQIWDEPNIAPHWGARPVNAADYAGLLREAALQVRGADPAAHILAAALAPNVEPGGANMSDIAYLDALYNAGAAEFFDIAAGQGYGFRAPPAEAPANDRLNFGRLALLREVMERHGDSAKPLWATSFGWYAAELPVSDARPWPAVAEREQAMLRVGRLSHSLARVDLAGSALLAIRL